ncbi:cell division protein FtsQ [Neoasaia chiangmaiensis NBRC 101099]|uniref:Cell division protein FtsQ n=1 Tax=Neoasaia chiangmaiensis TaxID=320497 RepID=A0A1U9KSV0_9PROT|nr:FtsQ-type POTRA domain-containing protein [Neoasaia chiangmaiensis]AQS88888.1 cell division protein FtsQ [Neoasaia chiangmaiensis]GBR40483.1 cell division protein FtsQ [Neoasaia chiangmaiensis NBRC 101099]GEN13878.1 hypothetical protein NCH01_03090 [Neoasaia chiangmaiensis]
MANWQTERRARGGYTNDRPSRMKMLGRRLRRLWRPLTLLAVLAALTGGAAILLHDAASEQRFAPLRARLIHMMPLQIRAIAISGQHLTTEASLMQALGTSIGSPIFGFSVNAARERIDKLPFVDHASVERHMPDTIVIHLFERSPVAVWQDHGHFVLINRAGDRVPDQGTTGKNAEAFLQLPLVVGDGANTAAAELIDELDAQPNVKAFVTAAVRVGARRWNLSLRDGTTVLLPEGQEKAALARLARYQSSDHLLERPVISIDMRLPDRMVIHQPPAAPPSPDTSTPSPPDQTGATAQDNKGQHP